MVYIITRNIKSYDYRIIVEKLDSLVVILVKDKVFFNLLFLC